MGGLEWSALPVVCEMYGVTDPEQLVRDLVTIRNAERGSDD